MASPVDHRIPSSVSGVDRNRTWPITLDAIHSVHHRATTGGVAPRRDDADEPGSDARKISYMAWNGFHRSAIGTKYQPAAQPGVNSIRAAPSARQFRFAK